MEVLILYLAGIALGYLTIELLSTSCSACNQLICHKWQINQSAVPVVPDWIYTTATIALAIALVILLLVWISHRRRVHKSKTYRGMVEAAEEHHMQCHAAIPNDLSSSHFTDTWKARPLSIRDIIRVSRLRVYDLNIVGVGFPLYNSAMISFLQLGVLFWLGNGISWGLFRDVIQTACLPFDHRKGAEIAAHDLALDRTWALVRLFIVSSIFHWRHAKKQRVFAREFDDKHMEMRDYALFVDGFPPSATSEKELTRYLQDAINKLPTRQLPEVVGVSIGFDFQNDVDFIHGELEEELMILGSTDSLGRKDRFGAFDEGSIREIIHEVRDAWREGERPGSGADNRAALHVNVSNVAESQDSSTEGSSNTDLDVSEPDSNELTEDNSVLVSGPTREEVRERLRKIKNSGRVIAVFRYPVNNKETAAHLRRALQKTPYEENCELEVHLLPADPPSILWEHFMVGLKTRERVWCFFCLSPRDLSLIKANLKILLLTTLLTLSYYILYARVYRAQQRAFEEDFMMTTLVTICSSFGNLLINQIVWSCAMDVGYRLKADRDAYVFRWYTLITLINTLFNFGVITATFSKKPEDILQRVLYESALGNQLLVFVRGSLVSYAIFPVFYLFLWLKGRVMLLWEYLNAPRREWARLRFKAEQAFEPPEWWLQYDYAAIVVMMTTSCFCLFIHGASAMVVFTLDVAWALAMVFINQYVYLALSRETYFSTDRLDAVASRAQGVPIAMLGVCILHWARRAGDVHVFRFCFVLVIFVSIIFVCCLENETRVCERENSREHVWYEGRTYQEAERAIAFNWWNVNPVYCLRHKYGLLEDKPSRRRTVPWRAGKSHLQPHMHDEVITCSADG